MYTRCNQLQNVPLFPTWTLTLILVGWGQEQQQKRNTYMCTHTQAIAKRTNINQVRMVAYRVSLVQCNLVVGNTRDAERKVASEWVTIRACPLDTLYHTLIVRLAHSREAGREVRKEEDMSSLEWMYMYTTVHSTHGYVRTSYCIHGLCTVCVC